MNMQVLQHEKIDEITFIEKIDKKIENLFITKYKNLKIEGLTEVFLIDLKKFEDILSNNKNKSFCKFYLIQEGTSLNLGLSFSDNEECPIKINNLADDDVLYILENDSIKEKDFREMKNNFMKGIGYKLPTHPENKKDTLICYSLQKINSFLKSMEDLHSNINSLKLNMFQYCPTNINARLSTHFKRRDKRIAFCVHVLYNENNNLYNEGAGYDLGNLMP